MLKQIKVDSTDIYPSISDEHKTSQYFETTDVNLNKTEHVYLKNNTRGGCKVDVCAGQNFTIRDVRPRPGIQAPQALDNPILESDSTLTKHKNV